MPDFNFILEFTKNSDNYNFDEENEFFKPVFVVPFPKPGIGKFKIKAFPFAIGEIYEFNQNTDGVEMVGAEGKYPSLPTVEEIEYGRGAGIKDEFPEDLTKPIIYVGPVNDDPYNFVFELKREERPKEGRGKSDKIKKRKKSKRRKSRKKRKSKTRRRRNKSRNIKLKGGVVGNTCNAESVLLGYTNDCNSMYEYCAGTLDDGSDWYCRERSYGIKGYQNRGPTDYGFQPVEDQGLSFSEKLLSAAQQRAMRNYFEEGRRNYDLIKEDGDVFDDPDDDEAAF